MEFPRRRKASLIQLQMHKKGIPSLSRTRCPDPHYVLPSRDYILGPFAKSLRAHLKRRGVLDYFDEVNDCDDFSFYAINWAKMAHTKAFVDGRLGPKPSALAVGEVWYKDNERGGHSTFLALTAGFKLVRLDRGKVRWRNGRIVTVIKEFPITKEELSTVSFCRFG